MKFLQSLLATFPKNRFHATFAGHLKFLCKTQKNRLSQKQSEIVISTKFLTHRVFAESTGDFLQNIFFLPLLAAILNFCVKRTNTFISETERDRAI